MQYNLISETFKIKTVKGLKFTFNINVYLKKVALDL